MTHNYNTKYNSLIANNEERPFNQPREENTRFDWLNKEMLNLKDVIIKDPQVENQRLPMKVNNLIKEAMSFEINENCLEQYGSNPSS